MRTHAAARKHLCTFVLTVLAGAGGGQSPVLADTGICGALGGPVSEWAAALSAPECEGEGQTGFCRWDFAFRDPAAKALFDELTLAAAACGPLLGDVGVNHPDTSTGVRIRTQAGDVRISLKDKSELGQTLVFVSR